MPPCQRYSHQQFVIFIHSLSLTRMQQQIFQHSVTVHFKFSTFHFDLLFLCTNQIWFCFFFCHFGMLNRMISSKINVQLFNFCHGNFVFDFLLNLFKYHSCFSIQNQNENVCFSIVVFSLSFRANKSRTICQQIPDFVGIFIFVKLSERNRNENQQN